MSHPALASALLLATLTASLASSGAAFADSPCLVLEKRICEACGKSSAACGAFSNVSDTDDSCQNAVEAIDGALVKLDTLPDAQRKAKRQDLCDALGDSSDEVGARTPLQSIASRSRNGTCDQLTEGVCQLCGDTTLPCTWLRATPDADPTHCGRVLGNLTLLASADKDARAPLRATFCDTLARSARASTAEHQARVPELCAEALALSGEANLTAERCSTAEPLFEEILERLLQLERLGHDIAPLTTDCDDAMRNLKNSPCADDPYLRRLLLEP